MRLCAELTWPKAGIQRQTLRLQSPLFQVLKQHWPLGRPCQVKNSRGRTVFRMRNHSKSKTPKAWLKYERRTRQREHPEEAHEDSSDTQERNFSVRSSSDLGPMAKPFSFSFLTSYLSYKAQLDHTTQTCSLGSITFSYVLWAVLFNDPEGIQSPHPKVNSEVVLKINYSYKYITPTVRN